MTSLSKQSWAAHHSLLVLLNGPDMLNGGAIIATIEHMWTFGGYQKANAELPSSIARVQHNLILKCCLIVVLQVEMRGVVSARVQHLAVCPQNPDLAAACATSCAGWCAPAAGPVLGAIYWQDQTLAHEGDTWMPQGLQIGHDGGRQVKPEAGTRSTSHWLEIFIPSLTAHSECQKRTQAVRPPSAAIQGVASAVRLATRKTRPAFRGGS